MTFPKKALTGNFTDEIINERKLAFKDYLRLLYSMKYIRRSKKFIDFLISNEGQKLIAETTTRPVDTSVKNVSKFVKPFDEIKVAYEDIPYAAEHRKEWQERWTNILTK